MFTGITAKYFSAKYRPPMIYGLAIYTEISVLVINPIMRPLCICICHNYIVLALYMQECLDGT